MNLLNLCSYFSLLESNFQCFCFWIVRAIRKQNKINGSHFVPFSNVPNQNGTPLEIQMQFNHSNTERVRNSNPHCVSKYHSLFPIRPPRWFAWEQTLPGFGTRDPSQVGTGPTIRSFSTHLDLEHKHKHGCCILWPAFGCCTIQTLVEICFSTFLSCLKAEKGKKNKIIDTTFSKHVFLKLQQNTDRGKFSVSNFFAFKTGFNLWE